MSHLFSRNFPRNFIELSDFLSSPKFNTFNFEFNHVNVNINVMKFITVIWREKIKILRDPPVRLRGINGFICVFYKSARAHFNWSLTLLCVPRHCIIFSWLVKALIKCPKQTYVSTHFKSQIKVCFAYLFLLAYQS